MQALLQSRETGGVVYLKVAAEDEILLTKEDSFMHFFFILDYLAYTTAQLPLVYVF